MRAKNPEKPFFRIRARGKAFPVRSAIWKRSWLGKGSEWAFTSFQYGVGFFSRVFLIKALSSLSIYSNGITYNRAYMVHGVDLGYYSVITLDIVSGKADVCPVGRSDADLSTNKLSPLFLHTTRIFRAPKNIFVKSCWWSPKTVANITTLTLLILDGLFIRRKTRQSSIFSPSPVPALCCP